MTTEEKIKVMQAWLEGKTIQIQSVASDEVWYDVEKEPSWDWLIREYRIKPKEKTSIPATEEEIEDINSVVFIKDKKVGDMYSVMSSETKIMNFNNRYKGWLIFNPEKKCWEDWS